MLVKCEKEYHAPGAAAATPVGWSGAMDDGSAKELITKGYFSEVRDEGLNEMVTKAATSVLSEHVKQMVDAQKAVLEEFGKRFQNFTPAAQTVTKADEGGFGYDGPENMPGWSMDERLQHLKTKSFNYYAVHKPTADRKFFGLGDWYLRARHALRGNGIAADDLHRDTQEHLDFIVKAHREIPELDRSSGIKRYGDAGWEAIYKAIITKATPTGMGEQIGADGGFLVPPEYSTTIFERVYASFLLQLIDMYPIGSSNMTFNGSAETSRVRGSRKGGIRAYWVDEAGTITSSFPRFRQITLHPWKLAALIPTTSELEQDAFVSLPQLLARNAAEEIQVTLSEAIINGTGAGQPLGIANAPNRIAVAAESPQLAATIMAENIRIPITTG